MEPRTEVGVPWLRGIREEEVAGLVAAAAADGGHAVVRPTHVIEKGGELAGYVSLGAVALVLTWLDRERVKARDTQYLLGMVENLAAASGPGVVLCLPCAVESPLRPYMEKLGYQVANEMVMCFKKVS